MRKKEVWVFDAGTAFSGNPKWLFMYIKDNRKDIDIYWFSRSKKNVKDVRKLGFKAYTYRSLKGKKILRKATTYVVNQVKEIIPNELKECKILNLWHGVGVKSIEKKVTTGFLKNRIAKKYIQNNEQYKKNQLFLVTSKLMEDHFKEQCGIDDDMIIRAGYPCCMYQGKVKTFDHDILRQKGLESNTKIAVYCPTYRDSSQNDFFGKAILDMPKLIEKLEKNNILLIFKMHPLMMKDNGYVSAKRLYSDNKHLLFWDNKNDIYEIFDKIDLAIVDYSSIFYDMLACGVPNFIRYIFDYDNKENFRDLVFDYKEMSYGKECYNFESLLKSLDNISKKVSYDKDKERIYNLFWEYMDDNSFKAIINKTLDFEIDKNKELKTLYSFDIFDTLFSRKVFKPIGIFYYVKQKMQESDLKFDICLINDFINIRNYSERNVRERKKKDVTLIPNKKFEITLLEIYNRIQRLYQITNEQKEAMMQWEIEAEIANVDPNIERIDYLLDLINNGNDVVLISDMYLPKDVIKKMLSKANPKLSKLPLYLSSDLKVQKTTLELFLATYFDIDYKYKQWIHFGDNKLADYNKPKELGIIPVLHNVEGFDEYEEDIISTINTYDSYLIANIIRKNRLLKEADNIDHFAYSFVALYYVPYVNWALKDAIKNGIDCLYFISRDGFYLKLVADELIKIKKYPIKTKYIYGSRKAWRIPSYIERVDDEFFGEFGNLTNDISSFKRLITSLNITESEFDDIFPELQYLKDCNYNKFLIERIRPIIKNSVKYNNLLLEKAEKERKIVLDYLSQEINFKEKFAFVEYWGRGYTQTSLHRLLKCVNDKFDDTIFYYARSIYEDETNIIRKNFTSNVASLIYVEAIFANIDYKTVSEYARKAGKVVPVIKNCDNNKELHNSVMNNLVKFCNDFYKDIEYIDEDGIERDIYNYALNYINKYPYHKYFLNYIATLKDSVTSYGKVREYAPIITLKHFFKLFKLKKIESNTSNIKMSLARSSKFINWLYSIYVHIYKLNITKKIKNKIIEKRR